MPSLCNNPDLFMHVRLLIINLGYSAAYFLATIMPVRYEGTLTQRRMRIGSFTFPDIGSMTGQYVIILSIPINIFQVFFSFQLLLFLFQPPVIFY